jgi:hypothetical protein
MERKLGVLFYKWDLIIKPTVLIVCCTVGITLEVPALILAMPSCHFCFSQLFFFYGQTVKTPLQDSLGKRGFEKQTYTQKISISD